MEKKLLLLFIALGTLWCLPAHAQLKCGTDEAMQQYFQQHPDALLKKQLAEAMLQAAMHQRASYDTTDGKYVIPLVFHIVHNYGPENIADSQVIDAVKWLNMCFSNNDPNRNLIIPAFGAIAADCHISFKLANRDPWGNCTNGIEHIASLKTYTAGDIAKISPWPHDVYMNIWVVSALPDGIAGYAYSPGDVEGLGGLRDGVIILHDYVGSIGTSSLTNARALPHEIGHTFNLLHVWGNGPINTACGDDGIFDTPETKGYDRYCPPNPVSAKICHMPGQNGPSDTGIIENYQNYMDYSYCSNMFTKGQREAMLTCLNSPAAGRNNLWTDQNKSFTGIDYDPPLACTPKADFYASTLMVCLGDAVKFNNASWRGATNYNWAFDDATPSTSTDANPTVTFNSPGWHSATLVADNGSAMDTLTRVQYIYVSKGYADYNNDYQEGFEDVTRFGNDWLVLNQGGNASHWQLEQNAGANSHNSVSLNNFQNDVGDIDELISPAIDLSQVSAGTYYFTFDYEVATTAASLAQVTDTLWLYYSTTCGRTWTKFATIEGGDLITNGVNWSSFTPSGNWRPYSVLVPNGAYTANTRFKIQYKTGGNGNNVYLDNINISSFTGIDVVADVVNGFNVFPNPASTSVQVNYQLAKDNKVKIELYDALGRNTATLLNEQQSVGNHTLTINNDTMMQLSQGIYLLKLTADGIVISKRLAVAK